MFLQKLSLVNFRNLENQRLEFRNKLNVFFGDNAQGKTNLLEAMYLISLGKSFRTRIDHELITWGQKECRLQAQAGFLDIKVTIRQTDKELLINKQKSRLTELIGSFITITFTPTDIEIISGSPERRRRFLDQIGSVLDKKYLFDIIQLSKVLKNRNQVLWLLKNGRKADLGVWNHQLVQIGSRIWLFRKALVEKLNAELKTLGRKLTGNSLTIVYEPGLKGQEIKSLQQDYLAKLNTLEGEEVLRGLTLIGPQRDDFSLISEELKNEKIVSKNLAVYGSRGEQRSAALSLKLSEVNLIEKEKNDTPVLLLDEVLSELDKKHRDLLFKEIRRLQAFITTTSLDNLPVNKMGQIEKFEVLEGKVIAR